MTWSASTNLCYIYYYRLKVVQNVLFMRIENKNNSNAIPRVTSRRYRGV